jgi:predicted AAA+ superfamily ATPase
MWLLKVYFSKIYYCYKVYFSKVYCGQGLSMDTFKLKEGIIVTHSEEKTINVGKKIVYVVPLWKWLLT